MIVISCHIFSTVSYHLQFDVFISFHICSYFVTSFPPLVTISNFMTSYLFISVHIFSYLFISFLPLVTHNCSYLFIFCPTRFSQSERHVSSMFHIGEPRRGGGHPPSPRPSALESSRCKAWLSLRADGFHSDFTRENCDSTRENGSKKIYVCVPKKMDGERYLINKKCPNIMLDLTQCPSAPKVLDLTWFSHIDNTAALFNLFVNAAKCWI